MLKKTILSAALGVALLAVTPAAATAAAQSDREYSVVGAGRNPTEGGEGAGTGQTGGPVAPSEMGRKVRPDEETPHAGAQDK